MANTNKNKGWIRGVFYVVLAYGLHALLSIFTAKGWITDGGTLALTGLIAHLDHMSLGDLQSQEDGI